MDDERGQALDDLQQWMRVQTREGQVHVVRGDLNGWIGNRSTWNARRGFHRTLENSTRNTRGRWLRDLEDALAWRLVNGYGPRCSGGPTHFGKQNDSVIDLVGVKTKHVKQVVALEVGPRLTWSDHT